MDLIRPPFERLLAIIMTELSAVGPTVAEQQWVRVAFILSYRGHLKVPHRSGGEAYIFHILRVTITLIRHQAFLGIKDIRSIVAAILHDSVEDAQKGGTHPVVMAGRVFFHLDANTLLDVSVVTKRRNQDETREEFCQRIYQSNRWRPLVVKFEDCPDNMDTLEWVKDYEKQKAKVRETELWFPRYRDRLFDLLEKEVALGRVSPAYLHLPALLYLNLMESVKREKLRLGMT